MSVYWSRGISAALLFTWEASYSTATAMLFPLSRISGPQDMKCVCVQYLVALDRLRRAGYIPHRTLRLSFVPDEEIGGKDGMGVLLDSDWYKSTM